MTKRAILLICLLSIWSVQYAQFIDFDNYQVLESKGPLPSNFGNSWKEKVDLINDSIQEKHGSKTKKNNEDFVLDATYSLDRFFSSGSVLFNTPLDAYVNKVFQHILESNGLNDQITVYVVKSTDVNAYAVSQNVIFINIGLLAKIETEAELAFVLCHEFIHYKNKHSFSAYSKNKEISKDYNRYKKVDENEVLLKEARFSRELEREADKQGLDLYLKTNYTLDGPLKVMETLKYADLPLAQIEFPKTYFETEYLIFPNSYFLAKRDSIKERKDKEQDENENLHSHPGTNDRKKRISEVTNALTNEGRKEFIVSQAEFESSRNVARFELLRMELLERSYELALFDAFVLEKEFPNSVYIKRTILKSLYGLSTYSNNKRTKGIIKLPRKQEGEFQQVAYFFDKLSKKELSYLTLHYAWKVHQLYPQDVEITNITNDAFRQSGSFHSMNIDFFSKEKKVISIDSTNKSAKPDFIQYAFVDYLQNQEFIDNVKKYAKVTKTNSTEVDSSSNFRVIVRLKDNMETTVSSDEDISKILLFEPTSVKLDTRKNKKRKYLATEKAIDQLKKNLTIASGKNKIELQFLDHEGIGVNDVQRINDLCFVSDFLGERIEHEGMVILPTDQLKMKEICDRYDVKHIGLAGEIRFLEMASLWNAFLLITPLMPYAFYKLISPKTNTIFFIAVYNLETNTVSYSTANLVTNANNEDAVLGNWYYLFKTLSKQ
jgi:hypothetical protein